MKAQVINKFGDVSVFESAEIAKPVLKPGHVIIKVNATSVNQIDTKIRSGAVAAIAPEFPAVLNSDVAGVIEAVADDVREFKSGDEVYGCAGGLKGSPGALAEYMLADSRLIAHKPKKLSMLQAAAVPLVGITAWEALFTKANLSSGQTILIHGGVGGVGHMAVQLAKWRGATVATTVLKPEDFALVKSFGADEIINAKEESVEQYVERITNGKGFDVVFDTVGGKNLDNSLQAAALNGHVVTTVSRSTHDLTPMHNKSLSLSVVFMLLPILNGEGRKQHGKILTKISQIVEAGKLKPLIDHHQFSFDHISDAHTLIESGKSQGKIVIVIAPSSRL
jgi:NADPH2:quinone reductase